MEPVFYANARELSEAVGTEWDLGLLAPEPSRLARIAFSDPYHEVEATFLVRDRSTEERCGDILAARHAILSPEGAAFHPSLVSLASPGSILAARSPALALDRFLAGEAEILAGIRQTLEGVRAPQCRVLSDTFCRLGQTIGVSVHERDSLPFINAVLKGMT